MIDVAAIRMRYEGVSLHLNERSRRLFAANEAQTAGRGGLAAVYEATGIARSTIGRGLSDLRNAHGPLIGRIRRPGGGRKPKTETEAGLVEALGDLVQSAIRGDPEAALLWVSKSQRHLVRALADRGYTASQKLVGRCSGTWGSAFRPTRKPLRGRRIRIATPNSNTSTRRSKPSKARASQRSPSTPRKKSWSATSRMADASCGRREGRKRRGFTISKSLNSARLRPMAFTILRRIRAG